jgi:hypothetical protein
MQYAPGFYLSSAILIYLLEKEAATAAGLMQQ